MIPGPPGSRDEEEQPGHTQQCDSRRERLSLPRFPTGDFNGSLSFSLLDQLTKRFINFINIFKKPPFVFTGFLYIFCTS